MMMPTSRLLALIYPNETCAYRNIRQLISSNRHFSPNICDEFGCNLLMYCLRFQYHRLLHLLLDEVSLELDFSAKDQQGNTILHYATIYTEGNLEIIDRFIGKYKEFYVDIDQRNALGFTPLLFGNNDFSFKNHTRFRNHSSRFLCSIRSCSSLLNEN